jgi:hypothetical protein
MPNSQPRFGFSLLFVSLLAIVFVPALIDSRWDLLVRVVYTMTLMACLYLVANGKWQLRIGILLAIPVLFTSWTDGIMRESDQQLAYCLMHILFLSYIALRVYLSLFEAKIINSNVVFSALSLYLLIGMTFSFIYASIELVQPNSIGHSVQFVELTDSVFDRIHAQLFYFSFVTLSTLGYGDISPVSELARSFSILEALIGQIYLAVIIARLIGLQQPAVKELAGSDTVPLNNT